jgi:hypothetical protein
MSINSIIFAATILNLCAGSFVSVLISLHFFTTVLNIQCVEERQTGLYNEHKLGNIGPQMTEMKA